MSSVVSKLPETPENYFSVPAQRKYVSSGLRQPDWVEQRPYQREAANRWFEADCQGILKMATGTGKTVTSLLAAEKVAKLLDNNLALIVAVPYQHLVEQWTEDLETFGAVPVLAYKSRRRWQEKLQRQVLAFNNDARKNVTVVTTHATFASESFQKELSRIKREEQMLIADEVHHLGAPHLRQSLPESIPMRMGLSATPSRFYDDEGSDALERYFGGVVYEYPLDRAIQNGALCEYYYIPHIVELTPEEATEYDRLSTRIGKLASRLDGNLGDADLQSNTKLKQALFQRARLLGTAEEKLTKLAELLRAQGDVSHTLVYCGDGSVETGVEERTQRHVDATVELLRTELGIKARRFTAEEDQDERQRLLEQFERGEVEALVAIRCLDEGVDVPATKTAYILASSSNPRQFIQRRGRILRKHPGKDIAVVHDFVVAPPQREGGLTGSESVIRAERSLIRKELERVEMFADSARNHPDANVDGIVSNERSLQELKRRYGLLDL